MSANDRGKRKQDAGGGGGDHRPKKKFWGDTSKALSIPFGTRGVLVSGVGGKEVQTGHEAIKILSEAYEHLCPEAQDVEPDDGGDGGGGDISALLASEVAELKDIKKQPFVWKKLGISALVYVEVKYKDGPTPAELVGHICREAKATQQNKARLCSRFYPIENVCPSTMQAMESMAKEIASKHFPADAKEGTTFSVQYDKRAAPDKLDRMEVVNLFAFAVAQPPHTVDLSHPAKTIMVNIVKGSCGVAVVDDFRDLSRFNLRALAGEGDGTVDTTTKKKEKEEDVKEEDVKEEDVKEEDVKEEVKDEEEKESC